MPGLGDVLRGLGSVLNPAVAQDVGADERQQDAIKQQLGMFALQHRVQMESPEYQAKVEALKNEKLFRDEVSQAGGDPTKIAGAAIKYGKPELAVNLYNQQEARAARLEAQKTSAEQLHEYRMGQLKNAEERATETARHNKTIETLQAQIAQGNQELKRMQFTMKADQQTQKSVQQLGGALEKANLPEADAVLGNVEQALNKNPKIAEYIAGPKAMIPDWAVPDDVKFGRQAFSKLFNITLKNRSGSAVTTQELERLKQEFAAGAFKTPQQLQTAVDQARDIINKHYTSVASGFGKDALDAYNENIRGFGGKVVLEGQKPSTPKVVDFGSLK